MREGMGELQRRVGEEEEVADEMEKGRPKGRPENRNPLKAQGACAHIHVKKHFGP